MNTYHLVAFALCPIPKARPRVLICSTLTQIPAVEEVPKALGQSTLDQCLKVRIQDLDGQDPHTMVARVVLNVYDLADTYNSWTYWCGVGVFHSGVEVFGVEYAFGGMCDISERCCSCLLTLFEI